MPVAWMEKNVDMFEYPMQTITNTVNCVGAMGKGLALQFKQKFPDNNKTYEERCKQGEVKVGQPYLFKHYMTWHPYILNFPTKRHWKDPSKLIWIEDGLDALVANYQKWGITS
jgi:O-acetyl-ADP-ribose deacetylase (regulator of RNase III)